MQKIKDNIRELLDEVARSTFFFWIGNTHNNWCKELYSAYE